MGARITNIHLVILIHISTTQTTIIIFTTYRNAAMADCIECFLGEFYVHLCAPRIWNVGKKVKEKVTDKK